MFDLLGKDIVGYNQTVPDTSNLGFEAGFSGGVQTPKSGVSYGDILGVALQSGSKRGSSGPMFGGMIQQQYGGQAMKQGRQNSQLATMFGDDTGGSNSSWADVLKFIQTWLK